MMLKLFSILFVALFVSAAQAATVEFTFVHPSASYTKTFTVPDAHLARLVSAYRAKYTPIGVTPIPPPLTNAEVLTIIVEGLMNQLRQETLEIERNIAKKSAEDVVAPITAN